MSDDQNAYLDSVALNLHAFYSGLERLFELIARHVDGYLPKGNTWHHDLLIQMANDLKDIRLSVIRGETAIALEEFRRFRHLVRNIYTINLKADKIYGLIVVLPILWKNLQAELETFTDFLEELAAAK